MREALLRDLDELHQFEIITMHDARLDAPVLATRSVAIEPATFKQRFSETISQVDMVWLIAPEANGALIELSELCYEAEKLAGGAVFLGSGFDTI